MKKPSFETLLTNQINSLTTCTPDNFIDTIEPIALEILNWFELDRMTIFPNSLILLNEGKSLSFSRSGIPLVERERYVKNDVEEYIALIRSIKKTQQFDSQTLSNSSLIVFNELYKDGGRTHCVIPLGLFNEHWGAVSCSRFDEKAEFLTEAEVSELELIFNTWLIYWQHLSLNHNLNYSHKNNYSDERDKLLSLSKKQYAVLELLAKGLPVKECAERLFLSPRTIESHKYQILDLLELETHSDLIRFSLRNGVGLEGFS